MKKKTNTNKKSLKSRFFDSRNKENKKLCYDNSMPPTHHGEGRKVRNIN